MEKTRAPRSAGVRSKAAKVVAGGEVEEVVGDEGGAVATPLPPEDEFVVPVAKIDPDPENPRGKSTDADVRELADSIHAHGLFHPLLVDRPIGGRYRLRAGHRRLQALKLLRRELAPARIYTGQEPVGSAVPTLVENEHREPLDPLREAQVVMRLLEEEGAADSVAARLSRSVSWVHRRARLANLPAKLLAERKPGGCLHPWPIAWLEDLAGMPVPAQERLLQSGKLEDVVDRGDLHGRLFEETAALDKVPWDLGDAELSPAAGACNACPKRSSVQPGLFEGEDKDPRCLEPDCFGDKLKRWRGQAIARAREAHGDGLVAIHGDLSHGGHLNRATSAKGIGRVLETFEYEVVQKNERGAKPAVVLDGEGAGKVRWVRPKPMRSATAEPGRKPRELTPAEVLEIETTGKAQAELWAMISKVEQQSPERLVVLVAAYGIEIDEKYVDRTRGAKGDTRERRLKRSAPECWAIAWRKLLYEWKEFHVSISRHSTDQHRLTDTRERAAECSLLAAFLFLDWDKIVAGIQAAAAAAAKARAKTAEGAPATIPGKGRKPARSAATKRKAKA